MKSLTEFGWFRTIRTKFFDIGAAENKESFSWKGLDISVITNSDYIMERLLKKTVMWQISAEAICQRIRKIHFPGIPLKMEGSRVIFGYVRHRGEEMDSSFKGIHLFFWKNESEAVSKMMKKQINRG